MPNAMVLHKNTALLWDWKCGYLKFNNSFMDLSEYYTLESYHGIGTMYVLPKMISVWNSVPSLCLKQHYVVFPLKQRIFTIHCLVTVRMAPGHWHSVSGLPGIGLFNFGYRPGTLSQELSSLLLKYSLFFSFSTPPARSSLDPLPLWTYWNQ